MDLLSGDCRRKCIQGDCPCIDNGLRCTNACKLKECENMEDDSDVDDGDITDSSDSESDADDD